MKPFHAVALAVLLAAVVAPAAYPTTYEVGPGKPYVNVGDVPWESINAGDTVLINWRDTPYKEKFAIGRVGTAVAPITVRGVAGPSGQLPVLDGNGATTRTVLDYMSEQRGVIKIGETSVPPLAYPEYIVIENLDIINARPPYSFTDDNGGTQSYTDPASSIYLQFGNNVTVRNCIFHENGNGFFVASVNENVSHNILIEGNYIYDNGNDGSLYEHNTYVAAIGMTVQYNHFGPLRAGCIGNNFKDRSARMVVRYNWVEGGNRQLDLVNGEDSPQIPADPGYSTSHVYGNVLIELPNGGNRQMIHYGGDTGGANGFRKGTMYLYNNTLVGLRTDGVTMMRLSTNEETCDCRNNICTTLGTLAMLDEFGILNLTHNWFQSGWYGFYYRQRGTINDDGTQITGTAPGFVDQPGQDYRLAAGSPCIDAGTALNPAVLPDHDLTQQYVKHQGHEARPVSGALDIGAFEYAGGGPPADLVITTTSLPNGTVGSAYSATIQATGGVAPYTWSIFSGSLPAGLSLNPSTGVIGGTPTTAGTSYFTAQVVDSQSPADSDTQALSITVNAPAPLTITTTSLPNARRNKSYSQTLQATGGVTPYTWSIVSGSLPPGLSLNPSTGVISGKATTLGTYPFTARVTDSQTPAATDDQALSITVTS